MKVPNLFKYDIYLHDEKVGHAYSICKSVVKMSLISARLWSDEIEIKFAGFANRKEY